MLLWSHWSHLCSPGESGAGPHPPTHPHPRCLARHLAWCPVLSKVWARAKNCPHMFTGNWRNNLVIFLCVFNLQSHPELQCCL